MASPPFDIVQTLPGDSDIASQFPALERTFRDVVESWLLVNHDNTGKHKFVEYADQVALFPTITAGNLGVWNSNGALNVRNGSGAINRVVNWLPGTRTLFVQNSVPVGWTLDTSVTDRVLRMSNFAGGTLGGSWTISGITTQAHTLSAAEIPSHTHNFPTRVSANGQFSSNSGTGWQSDGGTGTTDACSTCGNQPHDHGGVVADGNWRPLYIDVLTGVLN